MFIQYLTEQGHNVVKSERKPRKLIQYKDLGQSQTRRSSAFIRGTDGKTIATAVSRIDNLEFLSDVIPKTTTYKQFKEKRAKEASREIEVEKGQRTLNGAIPHANGESAHQEDTPAIEEKASKSPRTPVVMHATGAVSTLVVDRTVDNQRKGDDGDVEMADQ
jgi:DNA-directed RNA polymerase I subunit RPA43